MRLFASRFGKIYLRLEHLYSSLIVGNEFILMIISLLIAKNDYFELTVDLLFCNQAYDERTRSDNNNNNGFQSIPLTSFKKISSRKIIIKNVASGFCCYKPIVFEYWHFGSLDLNIYSCLIGFIYKIDRTRKSVFQHLGLFSRNDSSFEKYVKRVRSFYRKGSSVAGESQFFSLLSLHNSL